MDIERRILEGTNKCDWICKNHPQRHILYFKKRHCDVIHLCYNVGMPDTHYNLYSY